MSECCVCCRGLSLNVAPIKRKLQETAGVEHLSELFFDKFGEMMVFFDKFEILMVR